MLLVPKTESQSKITTWFNVTYPTDGMILTVGGFIEDVSMAVPEEQTIPYLQKMTYMQSIYSYCHCKYTV